ncbi:hypothetical protein B9G53_22870 [Pseudanabaena sp. SR411]|uniref:hypothetical protein n=1 Tax=Pseudanabaena sp. SR411 TaxID=1980935 RepID=UPI000B99B842|nr:hypothetical protein [Pseudanabaena sp. SR411]OYQ62316.1 hypothetical protein B9G53_22870 [Pseudanabaena sp. SR411]
MNIKSVSPLLTSVALAGFIGVSDVVIHSFTPQLQSIAIAAEQTDAEKHIEIITKNKGQIGGGDQLRRWFFGDLMPLGVQPGGAGMVVSLYNKANDVTFSYCATYDVVVAVRKGKVVKFPANEVK